MAENILAQQVQQAIQDENLAEFLRSNLEGRKLSIRGLAGLCGVDPKSIISSGDFKSQKLTEALAGKGFSAADLAENGFDQVATWLTIEYFAYESKAKAPFAKAIARTFGAFGVKTAFAQVTGSAPKPSTEEVKVLPIGQIKEAAEFLGEMFGGAYGESVAILNMRRHHPQLALPPVPAKDRSSYELSEAMLTPTQIAAELGLSYKTGNPSGEAANALLKQLGYQAKVSGQWEPTEKGNPFSARKPVDTNSRTDKAQLLWYSSILGELRQAEAA